MPVDVGRPGQSLLAEFERRQERAEEAHRRQHPILTRWFGSRAPVAQGTQAFAVGAQGEQLVADWVVRHTGDRGFWLFNRSLGRRAGDIDALGVLDSGIWIVDAKHYRGRDVAVRGDVVTVAGRRRPALTEGMWRQIEAVTRAVPQVPLHPTICVVGARLRRGVAGASVDGVTVTDPEHLAQHLQVPGPLDAATRGEVVRRLAEAFPVAA